MLPLQENNNSNLLKIDFLAEDKNTEFVLTTTQILFNRDSHGIQYIGVILGDPAEVEARKNSKIDPLDPMANNVLLSSVVLGSTSSLIMQNDQSKGVRGHLVPMNSQFVMRSRGSSLSMATVPAPRGSFPQANIDPPGIRSARPQYA